MIGSPDNGRNSNYAFWILQEIAAQFHRIRKLIAAKSLYWERLPVVIPPSVFLQQRRIGLWNYEEHIVLHRHAGVEFDHVAECVVIEVHQRGNKWIVKKVVTRIEESIAIA